MNIRQPIAAGFYEPSAATCRYRAQKLLDGAKVPADLPGRLVGGLTPHAGWAYSGRLAALTLKALAAGGPLKTLVLLGADHRGVVQRGEVYDSGVWRTPLGEAQVDEELAAALLKHGALRSNPGAHAREHSLEVQLPLVQALDPDIRIVPIAVPPTPLAVEIGLAVGQTLADGFTHARVLGSTDLTHYGDNYGFTPGGHGAAAQKWSQQNDRRMLDLIEAMEADKIVPEAQEHFNACGAGAVAATVAAAKAMGATRGHVLDYTSSYDVIHEMYPDDPEDTTVGYASVVFG